MNQRAAALAPRILSEIDFAERSVARAEEGWRRLGLSNDDYYLDGVALNLHGFYGGIERVFEMIATSLDGRLPQGENWHTALLSQMCESVAGIRPAVISPEVRAALDEYRGFRHVVRNVYTYQFDQERLEHLVRGARPLVEQLKAELAVFAGFLCGNGC